MAPWEIFSHFYQIFFNLIINKIFFVIYHLCKLSWNFVFQNKKKMVISLKVKTLDSQTYDFSVDDEVSCT